ncbi:MAG: 50S ribosomal protein L11 methyltransferase [Pseudomonadota bacterium]|nr:50S ribosomal protein L11 methyltransferase [Pseudomonadota bacterium]
MHTLTLLAPAESVETISDLFENSFGALSITVEDADAGSADEHAVFDEPSSGATGRWQRARITALFAGEGDATAAAAQAMAGSPGEEVGIESIAAVDDLDWVRRTQAQFGPSEIGPGFWIVPTWSPIPAGASRIIRLDPGLAFGTGTHPTTRMCLRWMVAAAGSAAAPWARVLDYGCGSGILAIAAAKLGASGVSAADIDPVALATTRANAVANGVSVEAVDVEAVCGRYELIVANILATPLKALAPVLVSQLGPAGKLVLAGILVAQADSLVAAYAPWLVLRVGAEDDGWVLMTGESPAQSCVA